MASEKRAFYSEQKWVGPCRGFTGGLLQLKSNESFSYKINFLFCFTKTEKFEKY